MSPAIVWTGSDTSVWLQCSGLESQEPPGPIVLLRIGERSAPYLNHTGESTRLKVNRVAFSFPWDFYVTYRPKIHS